MKYFLAILTCISAAGLALPPPAGAMQPCETTYSPPSRDPPQRRESSTAPPKLVRKTPEPTGVYCENHTLFVFQPDEKKPPIRYEWTIREADGSIVHRETGPVPYLFGLDDPEAPGYRYRPGKTYTITIRGILADGRKTAPARFRIPFRYHHLGGDILAAVGAFFELLLPDIRLAHDTRTRAVFSFPVGLILLQHHELSLCRVCMRTSTMVEPRIRAKRGSWEAFVNLRTQVGLMDTFGSRKRGRSAFNDLIVSADTGYLFGANGSGPGLGLAVGLGTFYGSSLHLVARRYFLFDRVNRYDFTLDVEFALFQGLFTKSPSP